VSRALTGIRPTGDLTVANVVGAMQPMVELQESYRGDISVFVADLHALTDQEPDVINRTRLDTVRSYLAAGINPERTDLYLQSQIGSPTVELASLLDRHISLAELMRVPTLKDKLRPDQTEVNATVALARYPILMAADIMIADATDVPVGKDQLPHIEVTGRLARRFNKQYGNDEAVLVEPKLMITEAVKIAGLNGSPKMSKSQPSGAIFLNDTPDEVADKVRRAQTAQAGEMTTALASHFLLAERLSTTAEEKAALTDLRARHEDGVPVMAAFKDTLTAITTNYLSGFQDRFAGISDSEVKRVLRDGGESASAKAEEVMGRVYGALGLVSARFLYE
jgi:tryptophanyl-tRNA synthetase